MVMMTVRLCHCGDGGGGGGGDGGDGEVDVLFTDPITAGSTCQ
jgi:hypothetical protein